MLLDRYETALTATREAWHKVEEDGMAFSLSAECGPEAAATTALAAHFAGQQWPIGNGMVSQATTTLFQDLDDNWWCRVVPNGLNQIGVDSPEAAYRLTELGIGLYQRLLTAPEFRFAIVGVEVDEFRTYGELCEEASLGQFKGLVLSAAIHQAIADRSAFRPFSPGYLWVPYEGEVYRPLMVSPVLKQQMSDLLVA
jgi:hypothetical protein